MEAIQPRYTTENLAVSLVFRQEFSFIHFIHFDPKSHPAILLTCKTWQIILTKELCNEIQCVFNTFEKDLRLKLPSLKKWLPETKSFDNSFTFRKLYLTCLLRLREIQESIFAAEKSHQLQVKKVINGLCLQTGIQHSDLSRKLFDGVERPEDVITLKGIQKTYDALKARSIEHLGKRNAALLMKNIAPFLQIKRIELKAPEFFKRVTSPPYGVPKSLSSINTINTKSRLFDDKRFAMIVNFNFCTPSEDALLLSEMSNSQLMKKIMIVFSKNLVYTKAIQKIWTHLCMTKNGRQEVKKLFIEQALSLAQRLMRAYDIHNFNRMSIFFENEPEAGRYKDLSFDLDYDHNFMKGDNRGYCEIRERQVRLFQDNIYLRSECIGRLFKILNVCLKINEIEILNTLQLMLPPQNYVLTIDDMKLLDSLFSPAYLAGFFRAILSRQVVMHKPQAIYKLSTSKYKKVYDFEFFKVLQQLLTFRYTNLEAVLDEGGLHCSYIKACMASRLIETAEAFINSDAIIDVQQTSAKKIRKKLHIYLKRERTVKASS